MRKLILIKIIILCLFLGACKSVGNNVSIEELSVEELAESHDSLTNDLQDEMVETTEELIENEIGSNVDNYSHLDYFPFTTSDIINWQSVIDFLDEQSYAREIIVDKYSDLFPSEVQDILIRTNLYGSTYEIPNEYIADYNYIGDNHFSSKDEELLNYPGLEEMKTVNIELQNTFGIWEADLNSDGIYEYVLDSICGGDIKRGVLMNINGEIKILSLYRCEGCFEILSCAGKTYILSDDHIEVYSDNQTSECGWNRVTLKKEFSGYDIFEAYSGDGYEDTDFLRDIELEELLNTEYVFEKEVDEEKYLYVTDYIEMNADDALPDYNICIIKQKDEGTYEIVKVYYITAEYEYSFEESERPHLYLAEDWPVYH